MSASVGMKSWYTNMLDSVSATLEEHRDALQQLLAAMEQDTYADELQSYGLMGVRVVLDDAYMALGDTFSRFTAAEALIDTTPRLVPPVSGSRSAGPCIDNAIESVQAAQESVERISIRVRAMAVLFTSEATREAMIGGEVAAVRGLLTAMFPHWHSALQSIANARARFN